MLLSKQPFSRFVVQKIFDSGIDKSAYDTFNVLMLADLVTHCNGNFVYQSAIRRLAILDITLYRTLTSDIVESYII
ncbi:hypothetical protein Bca4012_060099 [Brassica carinata]